ncbi:MAG: helix-turn-helix transcriptional regulator [Acidimicrobiales bacterium]|nr:helix-turn-helix transcriptional regulator [Acidimicrobiales bacterium]
MHTHESSKQTPQVATVTGVTPTTTGAAADTGGPPADSTRDRLLAAAAELFADRGVDAVSLREINRAAGARNASALHYHFGDRAALVRAVLAPHHRDVEAARHVLLDAYEADPPTEPTDALAALAGVLVRPSAAKLADRPAGPQYLRIVADLIERPRPAVSAAALEDPADSMYRWRALVAVHLSPAALELHRRFAAYRLTVGHLAQRARTGPHADDRLFTSDLIDMVAAVLAAPVSDATRRLHAERPRRTG